QRLFLGFRVGSRPETITQLEMKYSNFDWVHQNNDHLTLCFMGRLRRSQRELVINALRGFKFNELAIEFDSVEALDGWDNPSVIWLRPKASEYLLQVQNELR